MNDADTPDFYVPHEGGLGRRVLWSEATAEDHKLAIERFTSLIDDLQAIIDRHVEAVDAMEAEAR